MTGVRYQKITGCSFNIDSKRTFSSTEDLEATRFFGFRLMFMELINGSA
jgi:hypothetical protein